MRDDEETVALRDRVRDLESALGQRNEALANTFKLTPKLNNLLGLLLALPIVKGDLIQQRLGIASDSKVAKHRLNQALKPYGIKIHSKRLVGYWISDEDKARIKAMITLEGNDPQQKFVDAVMAIASGDEATEETEQAAA